jgi:valyl-tRNA synthetase
MNMHCGAKWENLMKFVKSYEPGDFEPEVYAAWETAGAFDKPVVNLQEQHQESFSIVMPPPNANGNLHIGHGLTIALEDSLTRYYRLRGRNTWYVPGADHAGFETWVVYERTLEAQGKTRFDYPREELYAQVWDFVQKQRGNMELQLRALGTSCSWKDLTFTLDENVVRRVYATFEKMWKDGMVYRGEKLVNFCTKHQTAFADIEVEHKDEKGKLWSIFYPLADDSDEPSDDAQLGDDKPLTGLVVSTTRPETLFGDTAVAVNPADKRYKHLIGKMVKLPLTKREIPIIADEHADMEYGTGVVKITPAHDQNDFEVGERHNLPRLTVIGFDGVMLDVCGAEYAGLSTEECRKKVLKDLKAQGLLKGEEKIKHAVAHCYKCGTVIEPLLKEQWFVNTEKLAAVAIEHLEANEIKFHPDNKKKVLINYLKGLKDWNISRQIPWGIPIPMFHIAEGVTPTAEQPEWIFDTRVNLKEIEVGGVKYERDEDTFDTWFSSSHWPIVCTDWEEGVKNPFYPLNVMETGADILFAWVARMIMMGLYVTGKVPFREVYLHGLVLDEHGQKMSKSKGNVINPMDLVGKYGSDAFRLGILRGRSAGMNQAFSENSVVSGRNLCNKLWNISRFIQGLVDEQTEEQGYSDVLTDYQTENMGEDWICRELNRCRSILEQDMAEYRFSEAVEVLYSTIWDKYADWFVESQKLYKNIPLLKATLEMILIMLHPFAPFVTETIWQNLSWTEGMIISEKWPSELTYDSISATNFESLVAVVTEIRSTLQRLPVAHKGKKYSVLYGDDAIVDDNSLLVKFLAHVPAVVPCDGQPRGLRLALANHELYLDVPPEVVTAYREALTERILAVGREVDALNARMMNPRYVERAPAGLVAETRTQLADKQALIERLKAQLELI